MLTVILGSPHHGYTTKWMASMEMANPPALMMPRRSSSEEHCATFLSVSAAPPTNFSSRAVTLRPYHTSAPCRLRASAWGFFVGRLDGWTGKFQRRSRKNIKTPPRIEGCPRLLFALSFAHISQLLTRWSGVPGRARRLRGYFCQACPTRQNP